MASELVLIVHNIRSAHNVGSILRTADGFGVKHVFITGYSPYPASARDKRLPHISNKINDQIHKTALGAEKYVDWEYEENPMKIIKKLKTSGFKIAGLEQNSKSIDLTKFSPPQKLAILLGEEVDGINSGLINSMDFLIEIPMKGEKESFNVSIATAIALYHCSILTS